MSSIECVHEARVVEAIVTGHWPDADGVLAGHAATCPICGEVAEVAVVLRADHDESRRDLQVPVAGQIWWRSAVRARLESAQAATRPMTWLHGVTAAICLGVMLAVVGNAWPSLMEAALWVRGVALPLLANGEVAGAVGGVLRYSLMAAMAAAAFALLAPVLVYLALSGD